MRCDSCPLAPYDDICPESEGEYGIEHKDGELGCRHPKNWVDKRDNDYCTYLGNMGTDMGIEMTLTESELARAIEICNHMVGLDNSRPYHRHGKAFYKPYRNYYEAPKDGNPILDKLPFDIITKRVGGVSVWYELTEQGIAWLSRQLNIIIKERRHIND